jgi:hypothetical protein
MMQTRVRRRDVLGGLLTAAWVAVMVLVWRDARGPALTGPLPESIDVDSALLPGDDWLGAFLKDSRIGWVHVTRRIDGEGMRLEEESVLNLKLMEIVQKVETRAWARVDKEYALQSFEFRLDASGTSFAARGHVRGTPPDIELDLAVTTAGETQNRTLPLRERPYFDLNLVPSIMQRRPAAGARYQVEVFDPQSLSNRTVTVTVLRYEELEVAGRSFYAAVLEQTLAGMEEVTMRVWADQAGNLLKMETPLGLSFVRERASAARLMAERGTTEAGDAEDLLDVASVALPAAIEDQEEIETLRVKLAGVRFAGLDLDDGAQVGLAPVRQRLDGDVLTIERGGVVPAAAAAPADTAPEELVQSDHPDVAKQAAAIVASLDGKAGDDEARARAIFRWVFETLDKRNVVGIPSALDVLRTKAGDCNEHTALFVALARAAGVPARSVVGVVHKDARLYYHAWPEVFLRGGPSGGRWLAVDPTWAQWPADVTHVRFIRGSLSRQVELLRIMGRLQVTVLGGAPEGAGADADAGANGTRDGGAEDVARP